MCDTSESAAGGTRLWAAAAETVVRIRRRTDGRQRFLLSSRSKRALFAPPPARARDGTRDGRTYRPRPSARVTGPRRHDAGREECRGEDADGRCENGTADDELCS